MCPSGSHCKSCSATKWTCWGLQRNALESSRRRSSQGSSRSRQSCEQISRSRQSERAVKPSPVARAIRQGLKALRVATPKRGPQALSARTCNAYMIPDQSEHSLSILEAIILTRMRQIPLFFSVPHEANPNTLRLQTNLVCQGSPRHSRIGEVSSMLPTLDSERHCEQTYQG